MTNKEKYRLLSEKETTIPIYSKPFWLDAVCGEDNWNVLLYEKGNDIVGALPYYVKKRYGLSYITQPKLTQNNGSWIKFPLETKYAHRLALEKEVMTALIERLEKLPVCYYQQCFSPTVTNWLPFRWKGYKQTTNYTYRIDNTDDLNSLFADFNKVVKKNIEKAEPMARVYESDNIERFYEMVGKTYERQGLTPSNSFALFKRLDDACKLNHSRTMFFAEDSNGVINSASYLVYDNNYVYQLMSGTNYLYRKNNFKTLLVWEGIKMANRMQKGFDFEGSMVEGIEEFFRKFGAIQTPYFSIRKIYSKNSIVRSLINKKLGD